MSPAEQPPQSVSMNESSDISKAENKGLYFNVAISNDFVIFPFQTLVTLVFYFGFDFCSKIFCQHFGASQSIFLI